MFEDEPAVILIDGWCPNITLIELCALPADARVALLRGEEDDIWQCGD